MSALASLIPGTMASFTPWNILNTVLSLGSTAEQQRQAQAANDWNKQLWQTGLNNLTGFGQAAVPWYQAQTGAGMDMASLLGQSMLGQNAANYNTMMYGAAPQFYNPLPALQQMGQQSANQPFLAPQTFQSASGQMPTSSTQLLSQLPSFGDQKFQMAWLSPQERQYVERERQSGGRYSGMDDAAMNAQLFKQYASHVPADQARQVVQANLGWTPESQGKEADRAKLINQPAGQQQAAQQATGAAGPTGTALPQWLQGRLGAFQAGMGELDKLSDQASKDINQAYKAQSAATEQDLVARGLTGTSMLPSLRTGIERERVGSQNRLADQITRERIGLGTDLGNAFFGEQGQQLANQTNLLGGYGSALGSLQGQGANTLLNLGAQWVPMIENFRMQGTAQGPTMPNWFDTLGNIGSNLYAGAQNRDYMARFNNAASQNALTSALTFGLGTGGGMTAASLFG